ncbi:MAG: DUF4142 domain-containing protein [Gemmatimonadaceae bacterium]|nr:DUF4142 domain-containing protein [Gemmatimonadaceae bacterium]
MKKIVLSLMTGVVLVACTATDKKVETADTAAMGTAPSVTASTDAGSVAATPAVTDPQIAAIVVAANDADIEGGRLAASKSTNAKVKEFANRMITDHGGVNKAAVALVTKLGVKPEESAVSRQQTESGQQARQTLRGKSGAEFDRAYIANEVTYHENLLGAIDKVLLPSAQNGELKALLEQTRPVVEAHLKLARELQPSLGQR